MSSTNSLTLPALLLRTLTSLLPIFDDTLSTSTPEAQQLLQQALADLSLARRMIDALGIFSENEQMEDVGDGEMVYMCVDWVVGEVQGRVNGDGLKGRIQVLERSQVRCCSWLTFLALPLIARLGSIRGLLMATRNVRVSPAGRPNVRRSHVGASAGSRGSQRREDQAIQDGKGTQGKGLGE